MTDYIKNAIAEGQREVDAEEAARELERQRKLAEDNAFLQRQLDGFPVALHQYASLGKAGEYGYNSLIFTLPNCYEFAAWKTDSGNLGFRFKTRYGWSDDSKFCTIERAIWIANQNWLSRPTQQFNEAED